MCRLHPWRFPRPGRKEPWATWCDLTVDPALSSRLDQIDLLRSLSTWIKWSYHPFYFLFFLRGGGNKNILHYLRAYNSVRAIWQFLLPGSQITALMPEHLQSPACFPSWQQSCYQLHPLQSILWKDSAVSEATSLEKKYQQGILGCEICVQRADYNDGQ